MATQRRLNEPWAIIIAAIITGVFALIAVLISNGNQSNSIIPSSTPTSTIVKTNASESSTPAQQSTDTTILTNTAVPPTETSTNTPSPSATSQPTIEPSNTLVSPTLSNTAQGSTLTLPIFRDNDSFTLYVPRSDQPYSLEGFTFNVTTTQGDPLDLFLSDFPSFRGMPFATITSLNKAICFRLMRQTASVPAPLDCSGADVLLLTQGLADADVFWYDITTNQPRTVTLLQNGETLGICGAGQSTCVIEDLESAPVTPTRAVLASVTPSYPCSGMVVFTTGGLLNQVRLTPNRNAQFLQPVEQGSEIVITMHQYSDQTDWYKITYQTSQAGWIPIEFISSSSNCPST